MTRHSSCHAFAAAVLASAAFSFLTSPACALGRSFADTSAATEDAIAEAALRFGLPADWIRAVIQAESGGNAGALSRAGAIGLMQLMPPTYAELRSRYGLGADPYQIRDNILAGSAYLSELHDRYGPVGMLAAYNAGPQRWEEHLRTGRTLPDETLRYLAKIGPSVGIVTLDLSSPGDISAGARSPARTLFASRDAGPPAVGGAAAERSTTPQNARAPHAEHADMLFVEVASAPPQRQSGGINSAVFAAQPAPAVVSPKQADRPPTPSSNPLSDTLFVRSGPSRAGS